MYLSVGFCICRSFYWHVISSGRLLGFSLAYLYSQMNDDQPQSLMGIASRCREEVVTESNNTDPIPLFEFNISREVFF